MPIRKPPQRSSGVPRSRPVNAALHYPVWYRGVLNPGMTRVVSNRVGDKCCVWGHRTAKAAKLCSGEGTYFTVVACVPGDGVVIEYRRALTDDEQESMDE